MIDGTLEIYGKKSHLMACALVLCYITRDPGCSPLLSDGRRCLLLFSWWAKAVLAAGRFLPGYSDGVIPQKKVNGIRRVPRARPISITGPVRHNQSRAFTFILIESHKGNICPHFDEFPVMAEWIDVLPSVTGKKMKYTNRTCAWRA